MIRPVRVFWLLLAALGAAGCSGQPTLAPTPAPVTVTVTAAPTDTSTAPLASQVDTIESLSRCPGVTRGRPGNPRDERAFNWPLPQIDEAQLELPDDAPCIGPEEVTPNDVRWVLRSRERRKAMLGLRRGTVTAFMRRNDAAIVEVETATARIRGQVTSPQAVSRRPFLHNGRFVPDGLVAREIFLRQDGALDLLVVYVPGGARKHVLPCSAVTLQRRQLDVSPVLPRALDEVVVAQEADMQLGAERIPLAVFTVTRGSQDPLGALSTLHARVAPNGRSWISLSVCGGTLFGTVPTSALLGPPRDNPWRLPACLDTDYRPTPEPPALERPLRCDRELKLYVRQREYLDAVGVIKAGARIQVEGRPHEGRVFVTLADAPVALSPELSCFELVESDVMQHCHPAR
jgi:hypothetical protein